jgi:nickel-dependent lactate racemase
MTNLTTLSLPYGTRSLPVEVPTSQLLAVASPQDRPIQADLEQLVRQALRAPIEAGPFSAALKPGDRLLLLVDDITRPTPVDRILPIVLEELDVERRGIAVTILLALGTHRWMTEPEIEHRLGAEISRRYPVVNHEWNNEAALVDLGTTANGTPIKVNRLIQEADFCIGIGVIVPHNLAGWSGGGKIVQPGICGKETTFRTHLLAARCPSSNLGKLANPVRAEIELVARQTNLKGVLDVVLDAHGRVVSAVSGQSEATHRRGVELARPIYEVPVPALADIVLVSSHPADIDFWQANKGLYAAEQIVKRGGDIILVTPCPEGISSQREHVETMRALQGLPSRQQYHHMCRLGLDDFAALTVSDVAARCQELAWVTIVSDGLSGDDLHILGAGRAASVEAALETAIRRQGSHASIVVLTHGGECLPVVRAPTD